MAIRNYFFAPLISKGTTYPSIAGYTRQKIDSYDFDSLEGKKILYILARRDPLAWRITKVLPALTVSRGFKIIPQSPAAYKVIKDFLFGLHKADPVTALLVGVRQLAEDAVWSGDGWLERKYSKEWTFRDDPFFKGNNIIGLKKIHPLTLDFKRDATGEVLLDEKGWFGEKDDFLAYTQKFTLGSSWKERDIDKRRVAHLKFNSFGDELKGISDLESLYTTIYRAASIADGIAQGAFRHGVPFMDLTVGDEQHQPDPEMLESAAEEVKNSSFMSEFVHPPWYKVEMHEQFSLSKSEKILAPFNVLISAATGIPLPVLMGSGEGTNKATIKELVNLIQPIVIAPRQQALKLFLESEVFAPLMQHNNIEGVPYVQWNELFPADFTIADKLKILSEVMVENKPLISWTEAREMAKLPAKEEGTFFTLSRQYLSAGKRGIYLVEPHGRLIHEGMKTAILSEKEYSGMVGIPLILISGNQAYGEIKLKESKKINLDGFKKYSSLHRVSDEERAEWWPDAKELFMHPIEIIKMYKFTKSVKVPKGVQKFISNVEFLNENLISVELGSRLDGK